VGDRDVEFSQLPDGFSSVLDIWAEILLQLERHRQDTGEAANYGLVLIDELELHLHAELQEKILPFLTRLFPQLQFIVTTHSPAIASSIDNATVFDLRTHESISSSELRGRRYGTIFTEWFGIATDFDLRTTAELERLAALAKSKPAPDTPDYAELTALADRLADRSHLLALQVRKQLQVQPDD
ncbi:MAG: AAA family ATPase, partial [Myxococcales bacterium]|nr:AAA family ATPase [Myxococcales bacterium]